MRDDEQKKEPIRVLFARCRGCGASVSSDSRPRVEAFARAHACGWRR